MNTIYKKGLVCLVLVAAIIAPSCKKFLDVNTDPNNPTKVTAANRLVGAITTSNGAAMWRGGREIAELNPVWCNQTFNGNQPECRDLALYRKLFCLAKYVCVYDA
ncbi:hypothetical protein [Pedobacter panaciterrae]